MMLPLTPSGFSISHLTFRLNKQLETVECVAIFVPLSQLELGRKFDWAILRHKDALNKWIPL